MNFDESAFWGCPDIERMSFRQWLLMETVQGVHAHMSANPRKTNDPNYDFFVVYGETKPIKDTLKGWGFRYFKGTWSTPRFALAKWTPDQLKAFTDLTGIDAQAVLSSPVVGRDITSGQEQQQGQGGEATQALNAMSAEIEKVEGRSGEKAKQILNIVQKEIEKLAQLTDEASQSDFVKRFWQFAAKFHKYSFHNTMLIFLQNPKATYVNSEQRWRELGRLVEASKRKEAITILAPRTYKKKNGEKKKAKEEEGDEEERRAMYFVPVKVYDISSTMVIPGQEDQAHVFEPQDWKLDTSEGREEITVLVNAAVEFAKEKGIDIDYEELAPAHGGFSTGKGITVNSTYDGINKFSTVVHEITHELFHQTLSSQDRAALEKSTLEYDAEATAFVVLSYFGFETKDAPRYLALWKADSEKIKKRGDAITKAARAIIEGIMEQMKKIKIELEPEGEPGPEPEDEPLAA